MNRQTLGLMFVTALGHAEDHARHHALPASSDADIVVTINPEARVSVLRTSMPPHITCGSPAELKVRVINQGFITAPLRAVILGGGARHVTLQMNEKSCVASPKRTGHCSSYRADRRWST